MKMLAYVRKSNIYNDSRATKEIEALADDGYRIKVFGWAQGSEAIEKTNEVFFKYGNQISCFFFDVPFKNEFLLFKIINLFFWFAWIKKSIKKDKSFTIIHSCDFDGGASIWKYAIRKKIKFVYDIYDYYLDSHSIPFGFHHIIERIEINIINNADLTIICTEERKEQIKKAIPKRLLIIYNSPDVGVIESTEQTIDYVYCGTLSSQRLLFEILNTYQKNTDLKFVFAGYGEYSRMAEENSRKFENFKFLGTIPYNKVLKIEAESKTIAAIYNPCIRNHKLCAPNKFYEALALGKPLIVCKGTGIDKIVARNDIGIVIDYDVNQFYKAVRKLVNNNILCEEMGKRARLLYEDEYRWSKMKERLLEAYGQLI